MRSEVLSATACLRKNRGSHSGNKSAELCVVTQPGPFHSSFGSSTPLSHLPDVTGCSINYRFTELLRLPGYFRVFSFLSSTANIWLWTHPIISFPSMQQPSECCIALLCSAQQRATSCSKALWVLSMVLKRTKASKQQPSSSSSSSCSFSRFLYQEGPRTEGGGAMCVLDSIRKSVRPPKGQGCKEEGCRPV